MASLISNLKSINSASLRALPMCLAHEKAAERAIDVAAGLPADLKYARRDVRRQFKNLLRVANAAKHLKTLPRARETYHLVVKGNYAAWDLVPAVARLATPARITALYVVTLGFSNANAAELLKMLDEKTIGRATLLCSCYFKAQDSKIFAPAAEALEQRGQRILAMRTHAKMILFALSNGRRITIESSANLRSCRNIEQFTVTNDAGLYDFHRRWIERIFRTREAHAAR